MEENPKDNPWKTFTEEIEVAGNQLVERVKELIAEGKIRRLRIKSANRDTVLEVPLTVGAVAGGAVALAAPWLAVLGAFATIVAHAKVEIVRTEPVEEADKSDRPAA